VDGDMSIREMREEIRRLNETVAKQEKDIQDNDESYAELVAECRAFKENAEASQTRIDELLEENEQLRSAEPPKPEVVHEPTKAQIKEIKDKAVADTEKKFKADIEKLTADLAGKDAEREAAVKAAEEEAAKKLRQAVGRSDPHAARVSFSMESIGRALSDINAEISEMEKEDPGSGTRLKTRCESSLLSLLGKMGWQI
jgi:chromosome segregation ATPase